MHDAAYRYFAAFETHDPDTVVVEIGSKIVQGTIRPLFEGTRYTGVDPQPGDGVDVVANGVDYIPPEPPDIVLCPEMAEHTPFWRTIFRNCIAMLKPGGIFIATMAGPGRPEHGVNIDDPDERGWYENIQPSQLLNVLAAEELVEDYDVDLTGDDLRCWARRRAE